MEKLLVPTLRFPEFRDAGAWRKNKIGDFIESYKGGASLTPSDFLRKSGYEVIPKKAIYEGGWLKLDLDNITYCTEGFFKNNIQSVVDSTYLLTTLRDLVPSGPSIGYIVKYSGDKKYILAQGVYGLKLKNDYISDFLIHFSNTALYRKLVNSIMVGSTQVHIRNGDFLNLPISVPSVNEQQKIASCLSSIDDLITVQSQKVEALKTHKNGLMQQLFPHEGETVPRLRFPEFLEAGDWEEKTLGQVAKYENGKAHEQDIAAAGEFVVVNSKFISTEGEVRKFTNSAFCIAEKNDILMVLSDIPNGRAIAKCFYVDSDNRYTVNQRICKLKPYKAVSNMLFYVLNRNAYFLAFDDGVKQTNLKKDDVLDCPILLPKDLNEQQKIADCISSIDELISTQSKKLDALKTHKKGLMQQLFPAIGEVEA